MRTMETLRKGKEYALISSPGERKVSVSAQKSKHNLMILPKCATAKIVYEKRVMSATMHPRAKGRPTTSKTRIMR